MKANKGKLIYIDPDATEIADNEFRYRPHFTGPLTIPDSVITIGNYAFYYCSGLTGNLFIGNSVITIGDYAFYYCSGFTGDLTIPDSVAVISRHAFGYCSGLTGNLTIPDSVISIGGYAFADCVGLTSVNAYVSRRVLNVVDALADTSIDTIHVRVSDATWTESAGQTIGGKTGITVIKDL